MYASIFLDNIAPIFLMAGAGFWLGRRFQPDIRSVSRLTFFVFSPCIVFAAITHAELTGAEFARIVLVVLIISLCVAALSGLAGRALRLERRLLSALVIASVFPNAGNFGLALNKFAFGDAALGHAAIYFVASLMGVYTLGVGVASLGRMSWRHALREVASVPAAYALLAAGLVRLTGWSVPLVIDRAVTTLSQAAIPVMLVLLGLQLVEVRAIPRGQIGLMGLATAFQLLVAPGLALALTGWLGLEGPARQAAVLEAATPAAVISTILAVEYRLDAAFITGVVLLSTLLSPLTLTPLIAYLQ